MVSNFILPASTSRLGVIGHLVKFMNGLNMDSEFSVTIEKIERGQKPRTLAQNNLQHKWHLEAAHELRDESADDKRAYCKLHLGVPMLRAENDDFRAQYDAIIRPLTYEQKLALMKPPIDFPVTRIMTTAQKTRFLDAVYQHYTGLGVRLSHPDDMGRAA